MSKYRIEIELENSNTLLERKREICLALNKLILDFTYTSGLDPIVIRAPDGAYKGIASLVTDAASYHLVDDHGGD